MGISARDPGVQPQRVRMVCGRRGGGTRWAFSFCGRKERPKQGRTGARKRQAAPRFDGAEWLPPPAQAGPSAHCPRARIRLPASLSSQPHPWPSAPSGSNTLSVIYALGWEFFVRFLLFCDPERVSFPPRASVSFSVKWGGKVCGLDDPTSICWSRVGCMGVPATREFF